MQTNNEIFTRVDRLLGKDFLDKIQHKRVIVFGVGGVGSWCAECLIRTGIKHLTIVDADVVATSNINRQIMATTKTIGHVKVEALKQRLLEIIPEADIIPIHDLFTRNNAETFNLESYDYIIDAIDSLKDKAELILMACKTKAVFFASMGAALKIDPTRIKVDSFWNVKGDPLARALRRIFKKNKTFPEKKFLCVYSDELLTNKGQTSEPTDISFKTDDEVQRIVKAQVNGSLAHITAIFGNTLAGLVIQHIANS